MKTRSIVLKIFILFLAADLLLISILGLQNLQNYVNGLGDPTVKSPNARISLLAEIIITEVMSSNNGIITDADGDTPDWIEIYNNSGKAISLDGAGLTTNEKKPLMWKFPDIVIEPYEYIIVFASGKDIQDADGYFHTNFKLSKAGSETLSLVSPLGVIIYQVELPALDENVSYGCDIQMQNWVFFNRPTPGAINNTTAYSEQVFDSVYTTSQIHITEYMTNNKSVIYDEFGSYEDWIEITNTSETECDIGGLYLSDNEYELSKWQLPSIVLAPNESLLIFASGKENYSQNIHAPYSLSAGELLTISNKYNEILDRIEVVELKQDVSYGFADGSWHYFPTPTPGKPNDTYYVDELKSITGQKHNIFISEVMSKNTKSLKDFRGIYSDWAEIKNPFDYNINLQGYGISKNENENVFIFPDLIVPASGYAILYFSNEHSNKGGSFYIPFNIDDKGDTLFLYSPEGAKIDEIETGYQRADISCGISPDGIRLFYTSPSPSQQNAASGYLGYSPKVNFSADGGMVSKGTSVSLNAQECKIYYTLDGSPPTNKSKLYSKEIVVNSPTVIRAISYKDGYLSSDIETISYLAGASHLLPIVSISTAPNSTYGENGIYENPYSGQEKPMHMEIYEQGKLGISFDAGFEIFGATSKKMDQKSFAIHLRNEYGTDEINYPLFGDRGVTTFSHFLLRTSGQDAAYTKVRDSFVYNSIYGILDVDAMDTRPCVVYINGDYFGIYYFREKVNEDYLASHHDVNPDKIDLLIYNGTIVEGDNSDYRALIDFVKTHDLSIQKNYDYVAERVDIDEFINYLAVECYFSNTDSGNIKYWKSQDGGKWRWIMYDMDWSMFNSTYKWNNISQVFNPEGMGISDLFSTTLHVSLMENSGFRNQFIETYAKCINEYFSAERLLPIFDEMIAKIEPEMQAQVNRWSLPASYSSWERQVKTMRRIIEEKPEIEKQHLKEFFGLSSAEMSRLFP
ncbi:MAG: CotH kinase family protein [Eubacteriales bacterium]